MMAGTVSNSRPEAFYKKFFLKTFAKFIGRFRAGVSFLINFSEQLYYATPVNDSSVL